MRGSLRLDRALPIKKMGGAKEKLNLVILGRSGSGKGTQAEKLVKRLGAGALHVSTGVLLRDFMKGKGFAPQIARRLMRAGGLHPSWLAAYLWLKVMIEKGAGARHLVFDGACRRLFEAKLMDEVMRWHGRPLPLCIYIDVSRREAMRRLLNRGRADDIPSAIRRRLDYFPKEVVPVLGYYRRSGRLIRVDGQQSPEKVFAEIDRGLRKRLGRRWPQAGKKSNQAMPR